MPEKFDKSAFQTVMATLKTLRADLVKNSFIPMAPDMPAGGGQGGPPPGMGGGQGGPPGGGMPPGMDPSQMQGPPGGDPSGGQGGPPGAPPGGPGGMPMGGDPSGGQGGPPGMPPGAAPGGAGDPSGGSDPYGPVFESILDGMQQLMETVQQMGQEFDQRIGKNEQAVTQMGQTQQQTDEQVKQIVPFIQSMQQPAPMDGSIQGQGGDPSGGQGGSPMGGPQGGVAGPEGMQPMADTMPPGGGGMY